MKASITLPRWIRRICNLENIKIVKRVIVSVVGATVLLIGVALLVLPGPAFIVIPVGLAILATETRGRAIGSKELADSRAMLFPGANARHIEILVFSFAPADARG
jgi:putative transmembrane protein PGPGW